MNRTNRPLQSDAEEDFLPDGQSFGDALRFTRAMEIETVGIALFDAEGCIVRANHAFLRTVGYAAEEIAERRVSWHAMTPPEWQEFSNHTMAHFRQAGDTAPFEKQYLRKDGSRFWALVAAKRLSDDEGIAFLLDITERKAAEASLRETQRKLDRSAAQLETIMSSLPALIAYVDPQRCFVRVNRAYADYFGSTAEAMVGRHMSEVLGEAFAEIDLHLQRALLGERQSFEVTIPSTLGARHMAAQHIPDMDAEGVVRGVVIQSNDITERKGTEHLLRTAEKLAAVGRLAASMAHEINNPLESVTNLLYLARLTADAATRDGYLEQADLELRRVSAITNQTLRFHKQSTRPVPVYAEALLESVLTVYGGRLSNGHVRVETRVHATQPCVCFDGEVRQVLSNLVSNALDAMVGREARLLLRAAASTDPHTGRPGLRLTVADTGAGMSPEILARMWEPFFTTKEIGGTGLGLWISRDIATRHEGKIAARTRQRGTSGTGAGSGTVFTLWLPLEAAER